MPGVYLGGHTELTQESGTGLKRTKLTEVSGTGIASGTDINRANTPRILWYVPYRTYPSDFFPVLTES